MVKDIHKEGGTLLGSGRGNPPTEVMVERLKELKVNILFTIGGDGTLTGAQAIHEAIQGKGYPIAVIGVPKTIDNDISFIQKSFGFESAVSTAAIAIESAHTEARGAINGIGLVKIMGRQSGFIAAHAALGMNDVNFVLIPEMLIDLNGKFLPALEKRILHRNHAVILVAEGVGQNWLKSDNVEQDAGGNMKLKDIGLYLKEGIRQYFKEKNLAVNLKYIDPSYIIRSTPANVSDSSFCLRLGQNAVHAGMAGKTGMVVGLWNNAFTHVPIKTAVSSRNVVHLDSELWGHVLDATGQPSDLG
jgi:6-phosphofructokinase 1